MKYKILLLISALLLLSCPNLRQSQPPITTKADIYQQGYATWYGPGFNGKHTASGEIYDMYCYTAAHRSLPLHTIVRVKNTENGNWTVVRINDRGPVRKTLIIDLSKIAAMELGISNKGSAKVQIEILTKSSNPLQRIFEVCTNLGNEI